MVWFPFPQGIVGFQVEISDAIITIRTRYSRYIGQYVLHCHILDHEDQGMMQNVQIVLPECQCGVQPLGRNL